MALAYLNAACGERAIGHPDARVVPDASLVDVVATPYRHTITLDGVDDFTSDERFATTSASFTARVTWDDVNLYIGYSGPDFEATAADAEYKWLFVYLDTSAGTGATTSERYNTQGATFPAGFAAEFYVRYKCNGAFTTLERYDVGAWTTSAPPPDTARAGDMVEIAIPLGSIGAGPTLGIVTWMINEKPLAEGTFAGLYTDNFTDGYAMDLQLTAFLRADFVAPNAPNDPANRAP